MTVRERVLTSRLIQKIDNNESYARRIGLNYVVSIAEECKYNKKPVQKKEKN